MDQSEAEKSEAEGVDPSVPAHVNFLLDPNTPLKFHITVGQPGASERFRVMKWMLIARSSVFRRMLWESNLKHSEEFEITDVDPKTFKHFLTFLYGHDNTQSLELQDSLKLLKVADKYDVADLKLKLGTALQAQVSPDNLFLILGCAEVCETLSDLWAKITDVIQCQTAAVFSHPEFISVSPQVVLHILQQDRLSVPELEVWRAALKWAKAREESPAELASPESLRETLLPYLKHIRLCTLSAAEFCEEVVPTRILTDGEATEITISIGTKQKSEKLEVVSDAIEKRERVQFGSNWSAGKCISLHGGSPLTTSNFVPVQWFNISYILCTKKSKIKLVGVKARTSFHPYGTNDTRLGLTFFCQFKIKIMNGNNVVAEIPFQKKVEDDTEICIPFQHNTTQDIVLEPDTEYKIVYESRDHTKALRFWQLEDSTFWKSNDDVFISCLDIAMKGRYVYNFTSFYYNTVE